MRLKREEEVSPLRVRGEELSEKLEVVRGQLEAARGSRERSLSLSSLDIKTRPSPPPLAPPPYNETFN